MIDSEIAGERVVDKNKIIDKVLKEEPKLIKDYKALAKKIRDDYQLKITDEELDAYFEPDFNSEGSALQDYYRLLNMNY